MDLNPQAWPELLLEFGPYAILALFILLVIPRSSKRLQQLTNAAPKAVRVTATVTVGISWGVVLMMVAYVLLKWSPVRVYEGQLGILNQSEQVYPLDNNIYVKANGTEAPGRERWQFVLVDKESNIKKEGEASFTYCWDSGANDCTDYIIPVRDIIKNQSSMFKFTKKEPEKAYKWADGHWVVALGSIDSHKRHTLNWGWNAYADDINAKMERIKKMLASGNRVLRAQGRKELRDLTNEQVQALKNMSSDAEVLRQIQFEQERRSGH